MPTLFSEDRQSYMEEALTTARILAGSLDYLVQIHSRQGKYIVARPSLQSLLSGLKLQADRVVNFLEECR